MTPKLVSWEVKGMRILMYIAPVWVKLLKATDIGGKTHQLIQGAYIDHLKNEVPESP